jgi:hypothetical protein
MDYDEQAMIEYPVIRYHSHLLTQFENTAWYAFLARRKGEAYRRPEVERRARESWGNLGDPRIDTILEQGYDEFSRNVTERVMREHGDGVVLNRSQVRARDPMNAPRSLLPLSWDGACCR